MPTCTGGQTASQSTDSMFISSEDTFLDTLINKVLPALWAPWGPVKLTHRISHPRSYGYEEHGPCRVSRGASVLHLKSPTDLYGAGCAGSQGLPSETV